MQQRLEDFGGVGATIVLAHANGYPPGSYRQMIACLTLDYHVVGYNHRPLWSDELPPARLDWDLLTNDLIETLQATQSGPVWVLGHSMGAVIAARAARRSPELFRGLVLIDPVFLPTRLVIAQALSSERRLIRQPMVARTLKRPNRFDDHAAAFAFYRGKRAFSGFSDDALMDYVRAGTRSIADGTLELAYAREWEASAYKSTPWVWPMLAQIKLPVLGLRGEDSNTLLPAAWRRWRRLQPHALLRECPGGHLLPMEHPEATARAILEFLAQH